MVLDSSKISLRVIPQNLNICSEDDAFTIYAENIISEKDAPQYGIRELCELTGYIDCAAQNFVYTKQGVYFIDTEYKSFEVGDMNFIEPITTWENDVEVTDPESLAKVQEHRNVGLKKRRMPIHFQVQEIFEEALNPSL